MFLKKGIAFDNRRQKRVRICPVYAYDLTESNVFFYVYGTFASTLFLFTFNEQNIFMIRKNKYTAFLHVIETQ